MAQEKNLFLLKPEGVKDILPAETRAKKQAERRILEVLKSWGYLDVITPTLEYGSIFTSDLKAGLEERMYRFFDGRGGTLVLRPDWTLPLARLVVNHLWQEPRPLRLAYGGSIFRVASPQTGKRCEVFQAGGELLGVPGPGADSEIIALAVEALFSLEIKEIKICIGHTGLLSSLLEANGLSLTCREQVTHYLIKRDLASLHSYLQSLPLKAKEKDSLLALLELQGGEEVIEKAVSLLAPQDRDRFYRELLTFWDNLCQRGIDDYVSLDFSFLRDLNYYTGMIFEIYYPYSGYPLGGGGRYDRLLNFFKGPLPAVGFALSIDEVLAIWQQKGLVQKPVLDYFIGYAEDLFPSALEKARYLRTGGYTVILDVESLSREQAEKKARELQARNFIYFPGGTPQALKYKEEGKGGAECRN